MKEQTSSKEMVEPEQEPIPGAYVFSNRQHPVEGVLSIQYRLNELVMTPAGPARIVGVFHDKENGRTQAIVALEGQPLESFSHSSRLAYVDWDQLKRQKTTVELRLSNPNRDEFGFSITDEEQR